MGGFRMQWFVKICEDIMIIDSENLEPLLISCPNIIYSEDFWLWTYIEHVMNVLNPLKTLRCFRFWNAMLPDAVQDNDKAITPSIRVKLQPKTFDEKVAQKAQELFGYLA